MVLDQEDKGVLFFLCDPGRRIGSEEKVDTIIISTTAMMVNAMLG